MFGAKMLAKRLFAVLAFTSVIAIPTAQAGPLSFYSIASISSNTSGDGAPASNLIQGPGVGFDANAPYDSLATNDPWYTRAPCYPCNYFTSGATAPVVLTIDLGQDRLLSEISIWGYYGHPNAAKDFSLRFATAADGIGGFGASINYNPNFVAASQGETMQVFDFSQDIQAQYVQMTITSNYFDPNNAGSGGDRVGLREIAFEAAQVPEPASLALLGLGLAGLGFSRRRAARA